ncbi:MAG: DUF3536 domain-containing protein, partial [bacterium]
HHGRIVDIVNNYGYLNFNFGPTLLAWYERAFPRHYRRIIKAAIESRLRLGHSNAIAQCYNHMIMPLANFRDRLTQVVWGLEDFKHRFGFRPDAMWLPETACNRDTLRLLIDHGMKYVILSPHQAEKVLAPHASSWMDVSGGSIDPKRLYIWKDRAPDGTALPSRSIAVFFYDGPLSRAVAFDGIIRDSATFADRIASCFDNASREDQVVSIATDGETYGHHHRFGDLTLSHLFRHELKKRGLVPSNFSCYLQSHPPLWEVEIKDGPAGEGTSWSCSHGTGRWKTDCDCGKEGHWHLKWRAPLRSGMDWLSDALAAVFETESSGLFRNPWSARNAYISVLLDRSKRNVDMFLQEQCISFPDEAGRVRTLRLMEMQKNAMFMYTSCGWFFSDISRIEAVQNLMYAARAMEMASLLGHPGLEQGFLALLETAPSNVARFANGRAVYDKLAKPTAVGLEQAVNSMAILRLLSDSCSALQTVPDKPVRPGQAISAGNSIFQGFLIEEMQTRREFFFGHCAEAGLVTMRDTVTGHRKAAAYLCQQAPAMFPRTIVATDDTAAKFAEISRRLDSLPSSDAGLESFLKILETSLDGRILSIRDLPYDLQANALELMKTAKAAKFQEEYAAVFSEYLPLLEEWRDLGLEPPPELKNELSLTAGHLILTAVNELASSDSEKSLALIADTASGMRNCRLKIADESALRALGNEILRRLEELAGKPSVGKAEALLRLCAAARDAGAKDWRDEAQNILMDTLGSWKSAAGPPEGAAKAAAQIKKLCLELDILVGGMHSLLVQLQHDACIF